MKLVSVIVPIYKVENYIRECIDSILNQTYKNLEIILVDDGSIDNCPKIIDEYSLKDARIKTIHKENGGLSSARNAGLDNATGDYICFIDSDDVVDVNFIKILVDNLEKTNSDLSICHFKTFTNEVNNKLSDKFRVYSKEEIQNNLYGKESLEIIIAWNKIYKKELWDNLRYPVGKIHEDEFRIHYILDKVKKVVITDSQLYYYRDRIGSIMNTFDMRRLNAVEALEDRLNFYKNNYKLYIKTLYQYYFMLNNFINKIEDTKVKKELKKKKDKTYKELLKSNINILRKIKVIINKR